MFAFPPFPPAAQAWAQPLAEAAVARLALFINHVLASEAVATQRLQPHAGRVLAVQMKNWPAVLPPWPPLVFRITPAGLMEWAGAGPEAVAAEARPGDDVLAAMSGRDLSGLLGRIATLLTARARD